MSYDEHLISMAGGDGDTVDQLAAIEARANAATEGPWEVSTGMADQSIIFMPDGYSFKVNGHPDSKFIAHARTDVPALLALVRERDAQIEAVRNLANAHGRHGFLVTPADIRAAITATEEA